MSPALLVGLAASCSDDRTCEIALDTHAEPGWVMVDGVAPQRVTVAGATRPVAGSVQATPEGTAFRAPLPVFVRPHLLG